MDWCDVCKYNPPDYSSHEPDKPCGDCWVYGEGNEPSKFVETENRQTTKKTHYDEIRAMSIEELADMFSLLSCCSEKGQDCMKYSDGMGGRNCYQCWLDWLKQEARE